MNTLFTIPIDQHFLWLPSSLITIHADNLPTLCTHSKYSKCHKKWEKIFSMPKNPLKPIYGQYVVGLEPFGTFKSGFGCYHSSILVLRVRKAVKMGNFAYFSFLDYQSSKSLFLWSRCVWMGSYEGDWSTLKP